MRRAAILACATALITLGCAVSAAALQVTGVENHSVTFSGTGCGAPDAVKIRLPKRARHIRVVRPKVGQRLESTEDTSVVATVTGVRVLRKGSTRAVRLSVKGSDSACPASPNEPPVSWTAELPSPRITFRRSAPVYFTGSDQSAGRVRPRILYLGASFRLLNARWSRWGGRVARGRATLPANDCVPRVPRDT
jgi:hypothetical protein